MSNLIDSETPAFIRRLSREDYVFDNMQRFLSAVNAEIDKLFNAPGFLRAEETRRQQKECLIQYGVPVENWEDSDYVDICSDFFCRHPGHYVAPWFEACIKASGAEWTYNNNSASIDVELVAKSWNMMPIPKNIRLYLGRRLATDHGLWHLLWDWFLPSASLPESRAIGEELIAWSIEPNDAIARLAGVLCEGEKNPPVRLVWEALPTLQAQQRLFQPSLLDGKSKNINRLDLLVNRFEKYGTPP